MTQMISKLRSRLVYAMALGLTLLTLTGCESNIRIRERGMESRYQGDYVAAQEAFARAAERKPNDAEAHYYLGLTELDLGHPTKAQLAMEKALAIRPDDPQWTPRILDGIAEAIYQQERYDALHAFLARTVRTYGGTDDYLRQGRYLTKTGDLDGAAVAFRKAAYFAPHSDPKPYIAIADFYEALNDQPNTVAALRWAYYVDPSDEDVAHRLRRFGIVPGPTVGAEPPKPELLR